MENYTDPNWQKEIKSFKGIKSTIIIEGNIHDRYPIKYNEGNKEELDFRPIEETVAQLYDSGDTKGEYDFLFCDPLVGFSDPLRSGYAEELIKKYYNLAKSLNEKQQKLNQHDVKKQEKPNQHDEKKQENTEASKTETITLQDNRNQRSSNMIENAEIIRSAITSRPENDDSKKSIAVVVNYASRFLSSVDNLSVNETIFFLNLLYASKNAINSKINTLIIIVDKFNDIPAWFYFNNPNVRMLTIPNPDRWARLAYIECIDSRFTQVVKSSIFKNENEKNRLADLTDGMKILELKEIFDLCQKENIKDIAEAVSIFKYGFKENRWLLIRDKIGPNVKEKIKLRVKGQEQAIDRAVSIIKRAVLGLSGMQHSSDTKPKGILFLSGPTGTGKTELVKAITELLFEDERSLIRFDMSEYSEEHSGQKLFGAPPGYVGYGQGGQLTNAVKNNPFSVLLFDEIEKAHPSIMDKFLQILEDGRMTDGRGNTVYFSETLIFFTSNIGIADNKNPDIPYTELEANVINAIEARFKPEVRNRIGENIVVFNYIDQASSKEIINLKIENITSNINKTLGIDVSVDETAFKWFYNKCWENETRLYGGRGIGNIIERYFLNPLSEFIFDNNCNEKSAIDVVAKDGAINFLER